MPALGPRWAVVACMLECRPGVSFPPSILALAKWKAMGIAEAERKENGADGGWQEEDKGGTSVWKNLEHLPRGLLPP